MRDYFKTLDAKPGSSNKELKDAWRKKCLQHHPDKGGDPEEFKSVMHAYKMLTEPSYRYQENVREQGMAQALTVNMQIPVDFSTAFFGRPVTMAYNRVVLDKDRKPIKQDREEIITITVNLPAGAVFNGYQYIEKKGGMKCEGEIGSAVIAFLSVPHPKFRPKGINILATEKIPLDVMLKGGKIEVETMYGLKTAIIPPASKPDDEIRIKKCGIMRKGDHVVTLDAIYPDKEGLKKGEWKGLKINWELEEENKQDAEYERMFATLSGHPFKIRTEK